jgi:hypothetical protein
LASFIRAFNYFCFRVSFLSFSLVVALSSRFEELATEEHNVVGEHLSAEIVQSTMAGITEHGMGSREQLME